LAEQVSSKKARLMAWHLRRAADMRIAKAHRLNLVKIRTRLGSCISSLSFIVFLALVAGAIYCGLNLLKKSSLPAITISMLGEEPSASESERTRVLVTNLDRRHYNFACSTEVFINGSWHDPSAEPRDADSPIDLAPKSQQVLSLPIPQEGRAWRVKLVASPVLGIVETEVLRLFRRLRLDYPSGQNFQVKGPEMPNRQMRETPSLLIARLDQKS